MSKFIPIAKASDIADQSARVVDIKGKRIALFNLAGEFYAIDDTCTHRGGSLSTGSIHGEEVQCPLHGARFNITTGVVTNPPASSSVASYPLRRMGDDIEIDLES